MLCLHRMSIGDGVFAQVYISITAGSFVTALALYMGASDFVLGLITAMPVLVEGYPPPYDPRLPP